MASGRRRQRKDVRRLTGTAGGLGGPLGWQHSLGYTPKDENGLVSVWDPSVGNGTVFADSFGGNDLDFDGGTPTFESDPPAIVLDGATALYDADSDVDAHATDITGEITMFATVFLDQGSPLNATETLFSRTKGAGGGQYQFQLRYADFSPDRTQMLWGDSGDILNHFYRSGDVIIDATWHTICGTMRFGGTDSQEIYENGDTTAIATATDADAIRSLDDAFFALGAHVASTTPTFQSGTMLSGKFGIVLLYSQHKTATQVRDIHNNIRSAFPGYGLPLAS